MTKLSQGPKAGSNWERSREAEENDSFSARVQSAHGVRTCRETTEVCMTLGAREREACAAASDTGALG